VAVALLLPVSVVTAGGVAAYPAFVHNTLKHQGTPLTNYMGLRTVVNYRPSEVGRLMRNDQLVDPWSRWKDARIKSFREAKPLYFGILICYLVLMGLAVRGEDPWVAIALSTTFIAFGVELTCYYYAFVLVVGLLYARNELAGRWLLAVTAFTTFIGIAPIQGIPAWLAKILPASIRNASVVKNFGMPTGLDEQYTWMSLATLFGFVMITWDLMVARQRALALAGIPADIQPAVAPEPAVPVVADDDEEKDAKSDQPVWRERLERRVSGGKRKRRR
jgi:hypothetical protein